MSFPVFDLHCDTSEYLLGHSKNEPGSLRRSNGHSAPGVRCWRLNTSAKKDMKLLLWGFAADSEKSTLLRGTVLIWYSPK